MKITQIQTFYLSDPQGELRLDHFLWVQISTDDGLVGLGETSSLPRAVAAVVHDLYAPILLGADPRDVTYLWAEMHAAAQFAGAGGSELRALSAIDVALWDIVAQAAGLPLYRLLGGQCHDRIRVYNTCLNAGVHRDLDNSIEQPGRLAEDLLADGFTAMKVWPFDKFAPRSRFRIPDPHRGTYWAFGPIGQSLAQRDIESGLEVLGSIRGAVGTRMDIAIEGHGRWNLPTAIKIAKALAPYDILFLEDAIPVTSTSDMAALTHESPVPTCFSERLFTRWAFRDALERGAMRVVMFDVCWGGGVTEGRNVATMADTYHLPFATHGATGPVLTMASLHVCMAAPNAMVMEVVRSHMNTWYSSVVTEVVVVEDGHIGPPAAVPGLGTKLREDFGSRADVVSQRTST
jgi:galactonate dehydratase